jgi:hypothetical protein
MPPLQCTITAENTRDGDDEETEEIKEKIRYYRQRRGQLHSSFCDQFMLKFQMLDDVISVQCPHLPMIY